MAAEHHEGYRCDLMLEPSQYCTVQPQEGGKEAKTRTLGKLQPEVFKPFTPSPLTEQKIREVLMDWVRTKPLLSSATTRGMVITGISHEVAYSYLVETFTEHRAVCLRFEPHCKVAISPKAAMEPHEPHPWKVPVTPAKMFTNQVLNYRLIHTNRVTGCPYCQGQKWTPCKECCGSTRGRCPVCRGRGRGTRRPCRECKGERMVPCASCMGLGQVCCEMCVGKGQLCYFKELRVDYRCHIQCHVLCGHDGVPEERLSRAAGEILHTAVGERVRPIATFPAEQVNAASRQVVNASHSSWPNGHIVQQRHVLQAVPVSRVQYRWRDTSGSLFIYGVDRSIYWPDYPQRRMHLCCPWLQDC